MDTLDAVTNDGRSHNWKLMVDPLLKKGLTKTYRINGICSNPLFSIAELADPRTNLPHSWFRSEVLDLPSPCFKIDDSWVGRLPEREVSWMYLNDNVNNKFLHGLCEKCGPVDEVQIFYHPHTKRHLGLARVVFKTVSGARSCIKKFNRASVMGQSVTVYSDPRGRDIKYRLDEMLSERQPDDPMQIPIVSKAELSDLPSQHRHLSPLPLPNQEPSPVTLDMQQPPAFNPWNRDPVDDTRSQQNYPFFSQVPSDYSMRPHYLQRGHPISQEEQYYSSDLNRRNDNRWEPHPQVSQDTFGFVRQEDRDYFNNPHDTGWQNSQHTQEYSSQYSDSDTHWERNRTRYEEEKSQSRLSYNNQCGEHKGVQRKSVKENEDVYESFRLQMDAMMRASDVTVEKVSPHPIPHEESKESEYDQLRSQIENLMNDMKNVETTTTPKVKEEGDSQSDILKHKEEPSTDSDSERNAIGGGEKSGRTIAESINDSLTEDLKAVEEKWHRPERSRSPPRRYRSTDIKLESEDVRRKSSKTSRYKELVGADGERERQCQKKKRKRGSKSVRKPPPSPDEELEEGEILSSNSDPEEKRSSRDTNGSSTSDSSGAVDPAPPTYGYRKKSQVGGPSLQRKKERQGTHHPVPKLKTDSERRKSRAYQTEEASGNEGSDEESLRAIVRKVVSKRRHQTSESYRPALTDKNPPSGSPRQEASCDTGSNLVPEDLSDDSDGAKDTESKELRTSKSDHVLPCSEEVPSRENQSLDVKESASFLGKEGMEPIDSDEDPLEDGGAEMEKDGSSDAVPSSIPIETGRVPLESRIQALLGSSEGAGSAMTDSSTVPEGDIESSQEPVEISEKRRKKKRKSGRKITSPISEHGSSGSQSSEDNADNSSESKGSSANGLGSQLFSMFKVASMMAMANSFNSCPQPIPPASNDVSGVNNLAINANSGGYDYTEVLQEVAPPPPPPPPPSTGEDGSRDRLEPVARSSGRR